MEYRDYISNRVQNADENFSELMSNLRCLGYEIDCAKFAGDKEAFEYGIREYNQQLSWMRGILNELEFFNEKGEGGPNSSPTKTAQLAEELNND